MECEVNRLSGWARSFFLIVQLYLIIYKCQRLRPQDGASAASSCSQKIPLPTSILPIQIVENKKILPFPLQIKKICVPLHSQKGTSEFHGIKWRFRLAARTHASHAWNTGSIPVGATKKTQQHVGSFFVSSLIILISVRAWVIYRDTNTCKTSDSLKTIDLTKNSVIMFCRFRE